MKTRRRPSKNHLLRSVLIKNGCNIDTTTSVLKNLTLECYKQFTLTRERVTKVARFVLSNLIAAPKQSSKIPSKKKSASTQSSKEEKCQVERGSWRSSRGWVSPMPTASTPRIWTGCWNQETKMVLQMEKVSDRYQSEIQLVF